MDKNLVEIISILDSSGSMGIVNDTLQNYIDKDEK